MSVKEGGRVFVSPDKEGTQAPGGSGAGLPVGTGCRLPNGTESCGIACCGWRWEKFSGDRGVDCCLAGGVVDISVCNCEFGGPVSLAAGGRPSGLDIYDGVGGLSVMIANFYKDRGTEVWVWQLTWHIGRPAADVWLYVVNDALFLT